MSGLLRLHLHRAVAVDDCQEYGEESPGNLAIQDQVKNHWSERLKR